MNKDKEVKCSAQRDKREWLDYKPEKAEEAAAQNDIKSVNCIVKRITSTIPSRSGPIKAKDGKLLSEEDPVYTLPTNTDYFIDKEVRLAIRMPKNYKLPGMYSIIAEMLKTGG